MPDTTIIIPIAPYHEQLAQHAVWSAKTQSVPVTVIQVPDPDGKGAGWARNVGLAQVDTDFVVFLDADDKLARRFVERTRQAWQAGKYVYTDWMEKETRRDAPACAWVNGTFHVISTLIPTVYLRAVGGFDETLPAAEDTDLYLRLMSAGYCGLHLHEALFTYGAEGQRSKALKTMTAEGRLVSTPLHLDLMDYFQKTYRDKPMGCCGEPNAVTVDVPAGTRQEGDVLALSLRAGNHIAHGAISGRQYERTGNGKPLWMDKRDVEAQPHLYRLVEVMVEPRADDAMDVFGGALQAMLPAAPKAPPPEPAPTATVKPNVGKVIGAYKRG